MEKSSKTVPLRNSSKTENTPYMTYPDPLHNTQFTYNFANIDKLSSTLSIPWEWQNDLPSDHSTTYIRFTWDLATMWVSLLLKKKSEYLTMIQAWKDSKTHNLNEVNKLLWKTSTHLLYHPKRLCFSHQTGDHAGALWF